MGHSHGLYHRHPLRLLWQTALVLCVFGQGARAAETVAVREFAPTAQAPALVRAVTSLIIRAPLTGDVSHLDWVPGQTLRRGQTLLRLSGPAIRARRANLAATEAADRAALLGARQNLRLLQYQLRQGLTTRAGVRQARVALASAEASFKSAQARWRAFQEQEHVRSPVSGLVEKVAVANGVRVAQGEALLRIAPLDALALQANWYGAPARALQVGMSGVFTPSDRLGPSVPVRVLSLRWSERLPGRLEAWLSPTGGTRLSPGEFGSVTVTGPAHAWPAVPNTALVLADGHSWVLVQKQGGVVRREVTCGPTEAGWTAVTSGLQAGERVIVREPYLRFHARFTQRYQSAD